MLSTLHYTWLILQRLRCLPLWPVTPEDSPQQAAMPASCISLGSRSACWLLWQEFVKSAIMWPHCVEGQSVIACSTVRRQMSFACHTLVSCQYIARLQLWPTFDGPPPMQVVSITRESYGFSSTIACVLTTRNVSVSFACWLLWQEALRSVITWLPHGAACPLACWHLWPLVTASTSLSHELLHSNTSWLPWRDESVVLWPHPAMCLPLWPVTSHGRPPMAVLPITQELHGSSVPHLHTPPSHMSYPVLLQVGYHGWMCFSCCGHIQLCLQQASSLP